MIEGGDEGKDTRVMRHLLKRHKLAINRLIYKRISLSVPCTYSPAVALGDTIAQNYRRFNML